MCIPRAVKFLMLGAALALPVGCARDRAPANVTLGKTRAADLKTDVGAPSSTRTLLAETEVRKQLGRGQAPSNRPPQVQVLTYEGRGEIYQTASATDDTLVVRRRVPEGGEATLQYWRHRWIGVEKTLNEVVGSRDPHGNSLEMLKAPSLNTAVIYDPARDIVTEVVEYGQRH